VPKLDHEADKLVAIPGVPPNMAKLPAGCPFSERCPLASERCANERPPLAASSADAGVLRACHREVAEVARQAGAVLS
jgi:oligopeptide transport system ATP-binding protein